MKSLKQMLIFVIIAVMLSGCGEKPAEISGDTPQSTNNTEPEKNILTSSSVSEKVADFTEVTTYVGDCDGDGADETIILSTSAERNNKGEFLWNDGQDWAIYVKDNAEEIYTLFDGFVQAGNVYFDVADYYMADGVKPVITVTVSTGAGLSIKNYSYAETDNGYVEQIIYDTQNITEGGINRRFTSVPEISK